MSQEDDEKLELPLDTLAALQEFFSDREIQEKLIEDLRMEVNFHTSQAQLSMDMFSEDWNASQFWYSDETATVLAKQLLEGATASTKICIVSAPSVFVQLKNLLASKGKEEPELSLLEFDNRFDVFKEFVHYDFKHPLALPDTMKGKYDRILCDPPFLSPDCQTKAAMTVRWLLKSTSTRAEQPGTRTIVCTATLTLLEVIPQALSHGNDDRGGATTDTGPLNMSLLSSKINSPGGSPQSYFAYPKHGGLILAHSGLMILAWFFILPIGVMLSIARFRLALLVQLSFLGVHSVGLLLGAVYRTKTPNLYKNNAHTKVGWVVTGIILAQCVLGVIRLAASVGKSEARSEEQDPISQCESEHFTPRQQTNAYRYSNDSGHFTASASSRSQSISSMPDRHEEEQHRKLHTYQDSHAGIDADTDTDYTEKLGLLGNAKVQRLSSRISATLSRRTIKVLDVIDSIVDYTILLLGFIAIISGAVVYGGVFRGNSVFNGLAHSVKGGIFFWYGLLTLGRWMGCFADMGWAWNFKPPVGIVSHRIAAMPSAEFVESFVIFLYGASNIWLEHLAAWGSAWSAQDFEHVSISIMFFGGGLCGMLVESDKVRDFLNTTVVASPPADGSQPTGELLRAPKSYAFSMNPFPGLTILLLGVMMSSHHQSSMVFTMVHKQWGTLFVGFALARAVTYILIYVSPPTSCLPSRPPSELVSSFCLISGGLIFMASNKDTVAAMEQYNIHAMFPSTLTMGFTAFLMAWAIITLAVEGWALRETKGPTSLLSAA